MSDFGLEFRLAFEPAMKEFGAKMAQTAGDDPDPHHYPFARRVRHGWLQDTEGHWAYQSEDQTNGRLFVLSAVIPTGQPRNRWKKPGS